MKKITKHINLRGVFSSVVIALAITSCGTPDQRSFEDGWNVFRNQCDDVSSTVRIKEQYQTSIQRQLVLHDQQNKTIYKLDVKANRTGVTVSNTTYANDLSNREIQTSKINRNKISSSMDAAIDDYFDQPDKHSDVSYGCLLKGFSAT